MLLGVGAILLVLAGWAVAASIRRVQHAKQREAFAESWTMPRQTHFRRSCIEEDGRPIPERARARDGGAAYCSCVTQAFVQAFPQYSEGVRAAGRNASGPEAGRAEQIFERCVDAQ